MSKRLFALAALTLLAASAANAGILRFAVKHAKPAAKHVAHGTKAVAKAAYKVAI